MAYRAVAVPLTSFQRELLSILGAGRTPDSYLAGGAAIHFTPQSLRYSNDLDFFHDSVERVATAHAKDHSLLTEAGYTISVEISQPGFVRALISNDHESTRIDWAHGSSWRFMPPIRDPLGGYLLHDVDLAINKTLALAGRDEPRDFVDIMYVHRQVLPLAALVWAAAGKDPGFSPLSLLELLRRRGHLRPEEVLRLELAAPFDIVQAKVEWLQAIEDADMFVRSRPVQETGCLYYSNVRQRFVQPSSGDSDQVVPHFGRPGGVLPQPANTTIIPE